MESSIVCFPITWPFLAFLGLLTLLDGLFLSSKLITGLWYTPINDGPCSMPDPIVVALPLLYLLLCGLDIRKLNFSPFDGVTLFLFGANGALKREALGCLGRMTVFYPGLELAFVVIIAASP